MNRLILISIFIFQLAKLSFAALDMGELAFEDQPITSRYDIYHFMPSKFQSADCKKYVTIKDCLLVNSMSVYQNQKFKEQMDKYKGTKVYLSKRETKYTFITIHGLYGTSRQLDEFSENFRKLNQNIIELSLSGHGYQSAHYEVTRKDWIKDIDQAIQIAKGLGTEAIVVGQSTGGLLSIYAGIEHRDVVKAVIAIEPALKVRTTLSYATCLGSLFVSDAQTLSPIASLFSVSLPKESIPISFGCEVDKLAAEFKSKYFGDVDEPDYSRIDFPIYVINKPDDQIVSFEENKKLEQGVSGPIKYRESIRYKYRHGSNPDYINEYASTYYQFLYENLSGLERQLHRELSKRVNYDIAAYLLSTITHIELLGMIKSSEAYPFIISNLFYVATYLKEFINLYGALESFDEGILKKMNNLGRKLRGIILDYKNLVKTEFEDHFYTLVPNEDGNYTEKELLELQSRLDNLNINDLRQELNDFYQIFSQKVDLNDISLIKLEALDNKNLLTSPFLYFDGFPRGHKLPTF